jgi:hypothetical protein
MRAAFISKDYTYRQAKLEQFLQQSGSILAIYVYPKNRHKDLQKPSVKNCQIHYVTYEDIGKTEEWLKVNSLLSDRTALILDNPSRYPKISSPKFQFLYRLEKKCRDKAIVDIVPFTLSIEYLYTPYSYLGRDILGYAHYYAFRENYHELDADGVMKMSHDFDLLADKIAPCTEIDYPCFLCPDRQIVETFASEGELTRYQQLRTECFDREPFSPRNTITKLADCAHAFQTRIETVIELLPQLEGETAIVTNLSSYAKQLDKVLRAKNLTAIATSYQLGIDDRTYQNCIYLEAPIVKSYLLMDIESRLAPDVHIYQIRGDTNVDRYLWQELDKELTQIDEFTQELNRAKRRQAASQGVFTQECAASSPRADRVAVRSLPDDRS